MGLQGIQVAFILGLVITFTYSFIILLPSIEKSAKDYCFSILNSDYCNHLTGLEGAYRITLTNCQYHWLLTGWASVQRACCISEESDNQIVYCLLAIIGFPVLFMCSVFIPSSALLYEVLFYAFFLHSIAFIFIGFKMILNFAWTWRVILVDESIRLRNKPTCYICTWLFFMHLTSSLLYALSLDIILAFFFFNDIHKCGTTILFLIINLTLCITAAVLSHLPPLRSIRASSQIVISMMTFYVMYTTWIALSDPENDGCNLYGTVFTGCEQTPSFSTRSITGLCIGLFFLTISCFKNDRETFITNVAATNSGMDFDWGDKLFPSGFHLVLAACAPFVLMSLTNWYIPEYEQSALITDVSGTGTSKVQKARLLLQEYNWLRFLLLCITSTLLPLAYIILLVSYICRMLLFPNTNTPHTSETSKDKTLESIMSEQLPTIQVFLKESIESLKKVPSLKSSEELLPSIEHMLLSCHLIEETGVRYWHFPRLISQAYYGGRNGSNACTLIAIVIGRLFSRSTMQLTETGYLSQDWIQLYVTSITEGNQLYDEIVRKYGVLDLSIEEAVEAFGNRLNVKRVEQSLPVSFESETVTATILYQLSGIVSLSTKQVVLFIHKQRTGAFLIYPDRTVLYVDSHSYGDRGSILIWCRYDNIRQMVDFLKEIMVGSDNRLSTLTVVRYENRSSILPFF